MMSKIRLLIHLGLLYIIMPLPSVYADIEMDLPIIDTYSQSRVSVSVILYPCIEKPLYYDYHPEIAYYPASTIKLPLAIYALSLIQYGNLNTTQYADALTALADMIKHSSNDATSYIFDLVTDTSSGGELYRTDLQRFTKKRQVINTYWYKKGLSNQHVNITNKPVNEAQYGREKQLSRNSMTTVGASMIMQALLQNNILNAQYKSLLFSWLYRDKNSKNIQNTGFARGSLPAHIEYYNKAGWTSRNHHDIAYIVDKQNNIDYIQVIFIADTIPPKATEKISQAIYEQLLNHKIEQAKLCNIGSGQAEIKTYTNK